MSELSFGSHQGTHLDAPLHFIEGGLPAEKVSLAQCVGPARVLDFSDRDPGSVLAVEDFAPFSSLVQPGSRLLLRFGWDHLYPDAAYYEHCPEMSLPVAEWLAARQIALIGMDTPTPSLTWWKEVHLALLQANVIIVEGLSRLAQLPNREVVFIAVPLPIRGGDGSPVRAMAIVEEA